MVALSYVYRFFEGTIAKWASELKISPYAFVREWIRSLSRVVRSAPAKAMVLWSEHDGKTFIKLLKYTVDINKYFAGVQQLLAESMKHIEEKVLLSIKLGPDALRMPSEDNQDEVTRGYGLFELDSVIFEEADHPSCLFFDAVCRLGLCRKAESASGESALDWDLTSLTPWLAEITIAWENCYLLMHLLSLPARGTEQVMWQHANSMESPRHLFFSKNAGTLVTKSNYNKGSTTTGIYKHIVRVIPPPVAQMLTILLRIVRPIELMAVLQFNAPTEEVAASFAENYSTRLFVTGGKAWDADKVSQIIQKWFTATLHVPFGMRLHRHFAQALQRRYISYQEGSSLGAAANIAFGHNAETAEMHYAREEGSLNIPASLQMKFEQVGTDWIKMHLIDSYTKA